MIVLDATVLAYAVGADHPLRAMRHVIPDADGIGSLLEPGADPEDS